MKRFRQWYWRQRIGTTVKILWERSPLGKPIYRKGTVHEVTDGGYTIKLDGAWLVCPFN